MCINDGLREWVGPGVGSNFQLEGLKLSSKAFEAVKVVSCNINFVQNWIDFEVAHLVINLHGSESLYNNPACLVISKPAKYNANRSVILIKIARVNHLVDYS